MIDLTSKMIPKDSAPIDILDPKRDNAPIGLKIGVAGPWSETYRDAQRKLWAAFAAGAEPGSQERKEASLQFLVDCTVGWDGGETGVLVEGEVQEFTPTNVANLYRTFPWIRDQVDSSQGDKSRFFEE